MSIIEKALDKLDERTERRIERPLLEDIEAFAEDEQLAIDPRELEEFENAEEPPPEQIVDAGGPPRPEARTAPARPPAPEGAAQPSPTAAAPAVSPEAKPAAARSTTREAVIDFKRLARQGFITPDTGTSMLAEQMRLAKRPLLMNASLAGQGSLRNGNLILVTSSLPGEGKTFSSINLAISIALELDRTVLLVDADAARSDVSKILGIESTRGFTDYLASPEMELADVLVRTNMAKLTVLPSGPTHSHVTELLSSEHMERMAAELSTRYKDRVVIFDSPPLLATTGASVLAQHVGQVLLVVEAVRTSHHAIRESLRLLQGRENVAILFNKSRERLGSSYNYGYYGGYGYGYGYGDRK